MQALARIILLFWYRRCLSTAWHDATFLTQVQTSASSVVNLS